MSGLPLRDLRSAVQTAEGFLRSGDVATARALYAAALARRAATAGGRVEQLTAHDGLVLEQLAALASTLGEEASAVTLLETAAANAEARLDLEAADRCRVRLLQAHTGNGDVERAQEVLRELEARIGRVSEIEFSELGLARFERRLSWSTESRRRLLPELYVQLGRLLTDLGMPCAALTLLARARELAGRRAAEAAGDLSASLGLAIITAQLAAGDTTGAVTGLDSLERLSLGLGWSLRTAELRGQCCFLRGELGPAARAFERVVELASRAGLPGAVARAKLNLAEVKLALNQSVDADRLLDDTIRRMPEQEQLGRRAALLRDRAHAPVPRSEDDPLPVIALQAGSQLVGKGDDVAARPAPHGPPMARGADLLARFEACASELRQQLHAGAPAERLLSGMLQEFGHSDSPLVQTRLQQLRAHLLLSDARTSDPDRTRALQEAERVQKAVCDELQRLGLSYELYGARRLLTRCWRELGRPAADIDALLLSNQRLLERMTAELPAVERAQFFLDKWRQDEEALAVQVNDTLAAQHAARWRLTRWVRRVRGVHALLERAYSTRMELTTGGPGGSRHRDSRSLVRSLLTRSRDQLTIVLLALPSCVVVLRLGWMRRELTVAPATRVVIRALVRRWHEAMTAVTDEEPARIAEELARRLGLDELLRSEAERGVRRITFVPDDVLHGFPFAALRVDGQYLVERFAVSIGHDPWARSSRPRRGPAVALAVDRALDGWQGLPATRRQLRDLEACLRTHGLEAKIHLNRVLDDQATLAVLRGAWLLHVSGHGTFEPDRPDATGLVVPAGDGAARVVSLRTLAGADLSGVEHVTLASCWGADNYVLPGRWIASLPQVMMAAGARSVLGCLWEIDDRRSTRVWREFYGLLGSMRRDDALRTVQLHCLGSPMDGAPNWWAGFQLYGEAGRIRW